MVELRRSTVPLCDCLAVDRRIYSLSKVSPWRTTRLTCVNFCASARRRGRRLIDPQERPVTLSKSEYALLLAFLHAPERPLSREYLLQATRLGEDIFDRSIDFRCCGCCAN